jgi:hypothetical protein
MCSFAREVIAARRKEMRENPDKTTSRADLLSLFMFVLLVIPSLTHASSISSVYLSHTRHCSALLCSAADCAGFRRTRTAIRSVTNTCVMW